MQKLNELFKDLKLVAFSHSKVCPFRQLRIILAVNVNDLMNNNKIPPVEI